MNKATFFALRVLNNFLGIIGSCALIFVIDTGVWRFASAKVLWALFWIPLIGAVVLAALIRE